MTTRANSLTERVTWPKGAAQPAASSPANDLRVLVNGLERLRYDVGALLASVGLRRADFDDPDARVPCEIFGALVGRAQQDRCSTIWC